MEIYIEKTVGRVPIKRHSIEMLVVLAKPILNFYLATSNPKCFDILYQK